MTKEESDFIVATQRFADTVDYILRYLPPKEALEARTMAARTCVAATLALTTVSGKAHKQYQATMTRSYMRAKKALRALFLKHHDLDMCNLPAQIEFLDEKIDV